MDYTPSWDYVVSDYVEIHLNHDVLQKPLTICQWFSVAPRSGAVMIDPIELARRRRVLCRFIGEPVELKRRFRSAPMPVAAVLVDVKRTRVLVRFGEQPETQSKNPFLAKSEAKKHVFGESGEWWVPVAQLLMPGSVEPAPGQRELIEGV